MPLEGPATQHATGLAGLRPPGTGAGQASSSTGEFNNPFLLHSIVQLTHCVVDGCEATCQASHRGHGDNAAPQGAFILLHGSARSHA